MKIKQQKKEMIAFRDFHGGDLINVDEVENATSKQELTDIINRHSTFLESVHFYTLGYLDRFKIKIKLSIIDFDDEK